MLEESLQTDPNIAFPERSTGSSAWIYFVRICALSALFYASAVLSTCSQSPPIWQQVQSSGKLRVVTRNNPANYYLVDGQPQGFEYDLIQEFANSLGVTAEIYTAPVSEILNDLQSGRAHIAAAGLTITPARKQIVDFGPVYQEVEQIVVGRRIRGLPKSPDELSDLRIGVVSDSSHVDQLEQIKPSLPDLHWTAEPNTGTTDLLQMVRDNTIDLTVIDSNEYAVLQRHFPKLAKAFTLSEPQQLAWAVRKNSPELLDAINEFFNIYETTGKLDTLKETHFGFIQAFDFVELVSFIRDSQERLPEFEHMFRLAARTYNLDWRFLAAMAYQESRWKPDAISATGVKGLMMLTNHTAEEMGIADREDPGQSIAGGTRYFLKVRDKIPERIQEPDRTWLALAAYNIGFGHLEDARILTQRAGKNPDKWRDIQEFLPLLEQEQHYSTLRYGKARGKEPVKYVNNIRDFYDLLKWSQRDTPESDGLTQEDDTSVDENSEKNILKEIFGPEIFRKP